MQEERNYVTDRFTECKRIISGMCESLPIKRKAINIYCERKSLERAKETFSELCAQKDELVKVVRETTLLFSESNMPQGAEFSRKLYNALSAFNLMTEDYSKLIAALNTLRDMIPEMGTVGAKDIGHMMNEVRMGYFPTDLEHVSLIKRALQFPDTAVNILDPCCGCGLALERLAHGEDALTYGVELDEARAGDAEHRLHRVGFGSFYHSHVQNGAFHALLLNPPYLNLIGKGGVKARSEKRFLIESMHNLMTGGVLIYIVPYYRLTWDIWRVLCDNFRKISVYRFRDDEFQKFRQVVVLGIKQQKCDGSAEAVAFSEAVMDPARIPLIDELIEGTYELPSSVRKVEIFKGAVFNLGELRRQLQKSKSLDILFEKRRIDAMEKRPLLPLNIGQVGLIGGSGLINGYVDCEHPHVIKGRVVKEVKCREYPESGTVSETRANRMLFNILTPDGVKRLT